MHPKANTATPIINERRCKGIGTCAEECPTGAIEIRGFKVWRFEHKHAVLEHPEKCTGCGTCVETCPLQAWSFS